MRFLNEFTFKTAIYAKSGRAGRPAVPKFLSYSMSEILVQRLREARASREQLYSKVALDKNFINFWKDLAVLSQKDKQYMGQTGTKQPMKVLSFHLIFVHVETL